MKKPNPHRDLIDVSHQANAALLAHLRAESPRSAASRSPNEVDTWRLDTHPELVEHLWYGITGSLPDTCHWVAHGHPVLVHPENGVIFGLAGGTSTLALRLPQEARRKASELPGSGERLEYPDGSVHAKDLGEDWILLESFGDELVDLCGAAFEYAGGF